MPVLVLWKNKHDTPVRVRVEDWDLSSLSSASVPWFLLMVNTYPVYINKNNIELYYIKLYAVPCNAS